MKCKIVARQQVQEGLPPCGGSGLKCYGYIISHISERLPPCGGSGLKFCMIFLFLVLVKSPSMRREGIGITSIACSVYLLYGLPPCGGSGLKFLGHKLFIANDCLPPCGGSGLKYSQVHYTTIYNMSPSMRREWIEISTRIFIIFPSVGLPPCGGSGLKCRIAPQYACKYWSPSMRREWIEMTSGK